MSVREVSIPNLVSDLKVELELLDTYLFMQVENNLVLFLHKDFLKYFGGTDRICIMDEFLDHVWGNIIVEIIGTHTILRLDMYEVNPNWRVLVGRASEWNILALRDQIERAEMLLNRGEPIIYVGR